MGARVKNIIEMNNICMSFSGNKVLKNVNFTLKEGEINSLIGSNGAGKSTLIKILNGIYIPDSGEIMFDGHRINIKEPKDLQQYGISFVHQELNLCPDMSVAENIFLGNWHQTNNGVYNSEKTEAEAKKLINSMGVDLDPAAKIRDLRTAEQQIVEILKALTTNIKVIVLDEPTSSLNETEKANFFKILRRLKDNGISIIFISHFLEDVIRVSDRITILKDGVNQGVVINEKTTIKQLVELMVGNEVTEFTKDTSYANYDKEVLSVKNINDINKFQNISFEVYEGEIVGVCGLLGAGKTEIAKSIFGLNNIETGEIYLNGHNITNVKPRELVSMGVSFLPEDRKNEGFIPLFSVNENITLSIKEKFLKNKIALDFSEMKAFSSVMANNLSIKMTDINQQVITLSGGNQQKAIIGKCLASRPNLFIVDEPTRGVDINAKNEIYETLQKASKYGTSILMFSSELEELIYNCDRIIALKQGEIVEVVTASETTKNELLEMIS